VRSGSLGGVLRAGTASLGSVMYALAGYLVQLGQTTCKFIHQSEKPHPPGQHHTARAPSLAPQSLKYGINGKEGIKTHLQDGHSLHGDKLVHISRSLHCLFADYDRPKTSIPDQDIILDLVCKYVYICFSHLYSS
jgi:hypothetical protein